MMKFRRGYFVEILWRSLFYWEELCGEPYFTERNFVKRFALLRDILWRGLFYWEEFCEGAVHGSQILLESTAGF